MEEMTLSRLREMKLAQMARRMEEIAGDPNSHSMAWRDAVASMVDTEYDHRSTRRLQELLRKARLKYPNANLESLDYDAARGLSKELMRELSSGRWIEQAHNVLISGPTGTGKSYLACALAAFACRRGMKATYARVSVFLDAMAAEASAIFKEAVFPTVETLMEILHE